MNGPLYLREEEFRTRFSMQDFLRACHQAFSLYGKREILNPPRSERVEKRGALDYFRLDMPAEWPGKYRARKVIEEYSDVAEGRLARREAYIELEDLERDVQVRLDAGHLTDMRTGAAGALGIQYLAGEGVRRLALVGTGRIAQNLALAADSLFDLEEIRATSRTAERRQAFAREVRPLLRARLRMTETLEECLEGAQAVLTAVPTPRPILSAAHLEKVPYLAVIAGDSRTRQLAPEVLEGREVVVDLLEQAEKSGEFHHARQEGRRERILLARAAGGLVLDMGDAACGRLPRQGPGMVYLTGMGAQDLCAAAMVYEGLRGS
jgi:alanine dehydrogenase